MATTHTSTRCPRLMMSPAVILLLGWMIVPLAMTIYFSFLRYNLLMPGTEDFDRLRSTTASSSPIRPSSPRSSTRCCWSAACWSSPSSAASLLALLLDQPIFGQGIVRILVIAPFFVMPTVSALVWKNMFMNPVNGLFA